jgi:hypothetical protein
MRARGRAVRIRVRCLHKLMAASGDGDQAAAAAAAAAVALLTSSSSSDASDMATTALAATDGFLENPLLRSAATCDAKRETRARQLGEPIFQRG